MSPRRRYSFFLDDDLSTGLKALKDRDGISEAEAVRRAIAEFLQKKGMKTPGKRAVTRQRT
jgi:hypothetical protein